jgi:hypothetical protein
MSIESGGHWYTLDGKGAHSQATKTKGAKPTRPTTIADAKRLGLLPSVSAYTRMLAAPYLERYKMLEVAKACYACPPSGDESYDDYARHILEKSGKDGSGAAEVGTAVHAALDLYFTDRAAYNGCPDIQCQDGNLVPADSFVLPAVAKIKSMELFVNKTENIIVNAAYGYAGTTDMVFTHKNLCGILDFKTKRTKQDEPVIAGDTHCMQIAAYHAAYWGAADGEPIGLNSVGYNVYISTTEIGRVEVVEYSQQEIVEGWQAFKSCLNLYRYIKKFDPRKK